MHFGGEGKARVQYLRAVPLRYRLNRAFPGFRAAKGTRVTTSASSPLILATVNFSTCDKHSNKTYADEKLGITGYGLHKRKTL